MRSPLPLWTSLKLAQSLKALHSSSFTFPLLRSSALEAAVQRQHEGSSRAVPRRNRPLRLVPVGAFSPKAVQWSNEGQMKAVLAPFCPYLGSTPNTFVLNIIGFLCKSKLAFTQKEVRRSF